TIGKGDEHAGKAIEEDGSWRAEGPRETGSEDAAEGLPEYPDDKSPKDGGNTGESRPVPTRRDKEPQTETDLDPYGRGRSCDRMVAPDSRAGVDEVLNPSRRGGRRRLDHLGRHAERHRCLAL